MPTSKNKSTLPLSPVFRLHRLASQCYLGIPSPIVFKPVAPSNAKADSISGKVPTCTATSTPLPKSDGTGGDSLLNKSTRRLAQDTGENPMELHLPDESRDFTLSDDRKVPRCECGCLPILSRRGKGKFQYRVFCSHRDESKLEPTFTEWQPTSAKALLLWKAMRILAR